MKLFQEALLLLLHFNVKTVSYGYSTGSRILLARTVVKDSPRESILGKVIANKPNESENNFSWSDVYIEMTW